MFNPMAIIQALGGVANIRNQVNQFQQGLPQSGFDPKQQAEQLQQQGFAVSLAIEGLGEVPEIQDLYVNKVRE